MSQYDFGTIDPDVMSGPGLATALGSWRTAVNSHHKGPTQPSYRIAGMEWIDDAVSPWKVKMYDGVDWILRGLLNPTTNIFSSPTADSRNQIGRAHV